MNWIGTLFDKYKFARRAALIWACWLITVTVFKFFEMERVDSTHATVIVSIIGILATVIGFYQWQRKQDDDNASISDQDPR